MMHGMMMRIDYKLILRRLKRMDWLMLAAVMGLLLVRG